MLEGRVGIYFGRRGRDDGWVDGENFNGTVCETRRSVLDDSQIRGTRPDEFSKSLSWITFPSSF